MLGALIIILYTSGGAESNNVKYFNSSIECYAELKKEIYSEKKQDTVPPYQIFNLEIKHLQRNGQL